MSKISSISLSNLFRIALVLVFTANANAEGTPRSQDCHHLVPLTADETRQVPGVPAGSSQCFEIDTPADGILTFDAMVAASAQAEARLVAVDASCQPVRMRTLTRRASHLAVRAQARTYRFCVTAQDPRLSLDELRILTTFTEHDAPRFKSSSNPDDNGGEGEDPREIEIGHTSGAEANPLRDRLCSSGITDDHADTFLCATPLALGGSTVGELRHLHYTDEDVFEFAVTFPRTVEIRTEGDTDTFGRLDNAQGYRLATDDDGGDDGNFRLVKTLMPGRYLLRVASARFSEGSYRLAVSVLDDLP